MIEPKAAEQAEVAVLGAAMLTPTAHAEVVDRLHTGMFTRASHRLLFDTLSKLAADGATADTVTVFEALSIEDRLDELGGPAALHDLTAACPSPSQAGHYCAIVEQAWRRRQVIEGARQIAVAAQAGDDGLDDLIDATVESWTSSGGDDGIVKVDDLKAAVRRRFEGGEMVPSWQTGWSHVDRVLRLPKGLLTVVTGIPGSGKSTWVDCLLWNILKRDHDVKVAMFSPEQAPADKHATNLIHTALGTDPMAAGWSTVERGLSWIEGRVTWLDDQRDNTVSGILARARLVKRRGGLDVLVVDPWNKIRHERGRHARDDLYIQEALGRFSRFARKERVAVVLVAHPKVMEAEPGSKTRIKAPTAYSISGGSEWDNQADVIVAVHRDKHGERQDPEIVQLIVQKVRDDGRYGTVGAVELWFDQRARRYGPVPMEQRGVA